MSDFDARNRFVLNGVYDLPFKGNRLVEGWEISLIEQIQSGNPLNFHTSVSNFTGNANLRPNVVGPVVTGYTPGPNPAYVTYIQNINSTLVGPGNAFGDLGRNAIIGPGFSNLDVALVKNTRLRGTDSPMMLQIRGDAFDVLNQANFGNPGLTVGTSTFGIITSTRFPPGDSGSSRQLQVSMKFIF